MMIYSGVLERHPSLRLVLAESGIGWLPYFVSRLDAAAAEKHVEGAGLSHPHEAERAVPPPGLATFEEEPLGPSSCRCRPDTSLWASDYPHPDSTFPHSREAIARVRGAGREATSSA
jgi:hypothetical protein